MWVKRLLRRLLVDDAEQPGECDPELYKNGETIAIITGGCSQAIEALVRRVGSELGNTARIDWHYIGGRGRVVALGDLKAARAALYSHGTMHVRVLGEDGQELRWPP